MNKESERNGHTAVLLGNTIWAAQGQNAFFNNWWWWPLAPAVALVLILGSLALINMGMDELRQPSWALDRITTYDSLFQHNE